MYNVRASCGAHFVDVRSCSTTSLTAPSILRRNVSAQRAFPPTRWFSQVMKALDKDVVKSRRVMSSLLVSARNAAKPVLRLLAFVFLEVGLAVTQASRHASANGSAIPGVGSRNE